MTTIRPVLTAYPLQAQPPQKTNGPKTSEGKFAEEVLRGDHTKAKKKALADRIGALNSESMEFSLLSLSEAADRAFQVANRSQANSGVLAKASEAARDAFAELGVRLASLELPSIISSAEASELRSPCQRPEYSQALREYEKVEDWYALPRIAGGQLAKNVESGAFSHLCSSRVSFALGKTGCKIPAIPGQTVSGRQGEQYIYRLSALEPFLRKTFGPPDCEWNDGVLSKRSKNNLCKNDEVRGIIVKRWNHPYSTATGHAYVGSLTNPTESDDKILFWHLPGGDLIPEDIEGPLEIDDLATERYEPYHSSFDPFL